MLSCTTAPSAKLSDRALRRVLLTVFGLAILMDLVSLALVVHTNISHPTVPIYDFFIEGAVGGIFITGLTLLLILRRPDHRVTWAFLGTGLAGAIQGVLGSYAVEAIVSAPGQLPYGHIALAGSYIAQTWFVLAFLLIVNLFPTGRTLSGIWRGLPFVLGVDAVLTAFTTLTTDMEIGQGTVPALIDTTLPVIVDVINIAAVTASILGTIAHVIVRYVRSAGIERQQLKWFVFTFTAGVLILITPVTEDDTVGGVLWTIVPIAVLASMALAILRYRLYEIDRIISRTVTYALVVVLLGSMVAAVAALVGSRFQEPLVVAAATLGVAALFNPLRKRVRRTVDRRFNRSLFDAGRVMDDFAKSLRDHVDPDEVVNGWTSVVTHTMQPAIMGVWIRG